MLTVRRTHVDAFAAAEGDGVDGRQVRVRESHDAFGGCQCLGDGGRDVQYGEDDVADHAEAVHDQDHALEPQGLARAECGEAEGCREPQVHVREQGERDVFRGGEGGLLVGR